VSALLLALTATPPGFVQPGPERPDPALGTLLHGLNQASLARTIAWLADPDREGRGLGSRGLEAATARVEAHLRACELKRVTRQEVPLRKVTPGGGTLTLRLGSRAIALTHGKDALLPELEPQRLELPLVVAPTGDVKALDVKGRAVLLPSPTQEALRELDARGARLVLTQEPDMARALRAYRPEPFFRAAEDPTLAEDLPRVRLASGVIPEGTETSGTVTLEVRATVEPSRGWNVLAQLPGRDPKADAVVIGAHLDHLGIRGGAVHPGADDNASGVAALMEIARVMAPTRPRRTIVFAFWTGEEEGKFGSTRYVRDPRWPLDRTRAYLNLDMIGHPWTPSDFAALLKDTGTDPSALGPVDLKHFAEAGHASWAPDLAPALTRGARATGMTLRLDPGEGTTGGSDYRPFARQRVPWVRFFGTFWPGYHSPQDTADQLDTAQVHRMARLILATLWELSR